MLMTWSQGRMYTDHYNFDTLFSKLLERWLVSIASDGSNAVFLGQAGILQHSVDHGASLITRSSEDGQDLGHIGSCNV